MWYFCHDLNVFSPSSKIISQLTEAALQVLLGKVFWKYAANLKENTHAKVRL